MWPDSFRVSQFISVVLDPFCIWDKGASSGCAATSILLPSIKICQIGHVQLNQKIFITLQQQLRLNTFETVRIYIPPPSPSSSHLQFMWHPGDESASVTRKSLKH